MYLLSSILVGIVAKLNSSRQLIFCDQLGNENLTRLHVIENGGGNPDKSSGSFSPPRMIGPHFRLATRFVDARDVIK
jgi:hypothetical protein